LRKKGGESISPARLFKKGLFQIEEKMAGLSLLETGRRKTVRKEEKARGGKQKKKKGKIPGKLSPRRKKENSKESSSHKRQKK